MSWDSKGAGRGSKDVGRANALADDDYDDDYEPERYASYDYDQEDEEYDEEYQDMLAENKEDVKLGDVRVQTEQTKQMTREQQQLAKERADAGAAAKGQLHAQAEQARETLAEEGLQVPDNISDDAVLAMLKRLESRRRAREQDLMIVSSSCPDVDVDFESGEIEFFKPADTMMNKKKNNDDDDQQQQKQNRRSIAAIQLGPEYPEQPAEVQCVGNPSDISITNLDLSGAVIRSL